jgi:hypothetical protein
MSNQILKSLSDYVVNLTTLKFTGRLIVCLDFYKGGVRGVTRTLEESLTVTATTCGKPNPD